MDIEKMAKGMGWFSIGLGLTQLAAPKKLGKLIGVGESSTGMRALGVRELASGVGVLTQERPKSAMWARVAGDAMDLALLGKAASSSNGRTGRLALAAGAVLGAGIVDYLCASEM